VAARAGGCVAQNQSRVRGERNMAFTTMVDDFYSDHGDGKYDHVPSHQTRWLTDTATYARQLVEKAIWLAQR